jgi:pimeloyl-ACP methyl ester carboxylesterase
VRERVERDVTASGIRLRVVEAGSGAPVVLLHGLFFDHRTWDYVIDDLEREFRLVAPDFPGFGESEKPAAARFPYGIDAFTEAVADLYGGLGLSRAAVVGHGLGGAVALTLAANHPELVSRLVLVDALCHAADPDWRRRLVLAPFVGSFVLRQLWGRSAFRAYFRDVELSPRARVSTERIDGYYESFNSPAARGSTLATLRATMDTRAVVARIARVQCDTLVVWGRDDRLQPAALGQRLARQMRHAGFELLDTGHAPQEEQPAALAQLIARFLRDERRSL